MAAPPHVQARITLGQRLAELRAAAGFTQHSLAPLTLYGRSTVANVELGRQNVSRDFWVRCDAALDAGGELVAAYDRLRAPGGTPPAATPARALSAVSLLPAAAVGSTVTATGAAPSPLPVAGGDGLLRLWAPAGQFFPGVTIDAQSHPATENGRILAAVPHGYADDPFLRRPARGLVLARSEAPDGAVFGLDTRHARRLLRGVPAGARLPIPRAYRMDELTFAVLWAVANLDEAILADDGLLDQCEQDLAGYARMTRSAAGGDLAADLSPVGRMWLGSAFCAGHIRRHTGALADVPVFWTREQRGEQASTWLLLPTSTTTYGRPPPSTPTPAPPGCSAYPAPRWTPRPAGSGSCCCSRWR